MNYNKIKIIFYLFVSFLLIQSSEKTFNYVFIIDVSTSMIGVPPSETSVNIFPELKDEVCSFIDKIELPANVFIYTFDAGLSSSKAFNLENTNMKSSIKDYVTSLSADGQSTWIFRSLSSVLDSIALFKDQNADNENITVFYLFTDGKDNDSHGNWRMSDILREYSLKRGAFDWLFYSTLGVELEDYEKKLLEESSNVKLVENEKGVVHPIILIENIIPIINLGNLWNVDTITWVNIFGIKESESANYKIKTSLKYPMISAKGLGVKIEPSNFDLNESKEVMFRLELINFTKNIIGIQGNYSLKIKLIPEDDLIDIIPNEIEVRFSYETPKAVKILTEETDNASLNLGKLKSSDNELIEKKIRFIYDFQKESSKGSIHAENIPDENSLGVNILFEDKKEIVITNKDSIIILFNLNKNPSKGTYKGVLRFSSDSFDLKGGKGDKYGVDKNVVEIPWSFVIPSKPVPLWIWIVIIIFLLISIIYSYRYLTKPPILKDFKIDFIEPEKLEITLDGMTNVLFGKNGSFLNNTDQSFRIFAKKDEGLIKAILEVNEGDFMIKKYGTTEFTNVISSEELYDGDLVKFGSYVARISSFTLNRE